MIACLQGTVLSTGKDFIVLMTTGNVGYKIFVPFTTLDRIETHKELFLFTSLIVREDSMTLYGFATASEQETFDILLSITGIGPRTALAILSTLSLDNLKNAVVADRPEILTRVPGIGKKTAQKMLIELKDKLKLGMDTAPVAGFDDFNSDVLDTLVALGYSIVEAQSAIQSLPKDAPPNVEERVRLALGYFA